MKNYGKIFKILMLVLILISVALLVLGFVSGFEANDGKAVETLLYWAYFMIGFAIFACIIIGLIITFIPSLSTVTTSDESMCGYVALGVTAWSKNPFLGMAAAILVRFLGQYVGLV